MALHETASQTVGPFFSIGLSQMYITELATPDLPGEHVTIRGHILDGDGNPVPDAIIEIWQANSEGQYADTADGQQGSLSTGFIGFGRIPTDEAGMFQFITIKPGSVAGPDDLIQGPHLVVLVYMRGLLRHLVTRMYFPDEPANNDDPILKLIPSDRRITLIAEKEEAISGHLLWDIHLQGPMETVFFDY